MKLSCNSCGQSVLFVHTFYAAADTTAAKSLVMAYFVFMSLRIKPVALHLLGWILFFALVIGFIDYSPQGEGFERPFEPALLLFFLVYVFLFYFNAYVLVPQLYLKKKFVFYALVALALFAVVFLLKPYEHLVRMHMRPFGEDGPPPFEHLPPRRGPHLRGPGRGERGLDIVSVVLFVGIWSVSMALQIFRQWRHTERRALQAEADKVNAELSFLRAQINPHFLFNTLNNIYSLSIARSEQTPNAIMKLSEILHYITDDVRNDFVPLQSEVACVKSYIELQQLRLTDKVDVQFTVKGNLDGKQIAPLLFMTFIENAFKYGISSHEPCAIIIRITASEKSIEFYCRNQVMVRKATEERTGVGIRNAEKRLEYLYPNNYLLNVDTKEEHFSVHLTILK